VVKSWLHKIFGSRNQRILRDCYSTVAAINAIEASLINLSNAALQAKTSQFKTALTAGTTTLDQLLPEAFAVVREASRRVLSMRHFDVQLIGGMVLHAGKVAEMSTGEGKTLVATLPAYLNALTGEGVHVVTINDYLAKRDAEWNRPLYESLGLSVGFVVHGMSLAEKQAEYRKDIVYVTSNELVFDYLRDNMAFSGDQRVLRSLHYVIVDEADFIFIDEARTPLIISGPEEDSSALYLQINLLVQQLALQTTKDGAGDFYLDKKSKQALLTEDGHVKVEHLLQEAGLLTADSNLYDSNNLRLVHHVYAALKANYLFKRDVDYIVKDKQIIIVDEHTGRVSPGRRWSDGLHQAIEAKEKVPVQSESQTLASITFQKYFKLYQKLSGMTGTADTEAAELQQIYNLEVVVIPTNRPSQRQDAADRVYLTQAEKFAAILADVQDCVARQQPVLVGTASIESSEHVAALLRQNNIRHKVLNAKLHEQEAEIIAEAGRPGAVTIATNMAGRGTDIVLGGNLEAELAAIELEFTQKQQVTDYLAEKTAMETACREAWLARHEAVKKTGGLRVIGTERYESRRIDNQLRGRSARQGDPGSTIFYLALTDNLLRIFISEKISGFLGKLGMQEGEAITHPWLNKAIENAQRKVEEHNFDIRKQLLEFDEVADDQRRVIYKQRNELIDKPDVAEIIQNVLDDVVVEVFYTFVTIDSEPSAWDLTGLTACLQEEFGVTLDLPQLLMHMPLEQEEQGLLQAVQAKISQTLAERTAMVGVETMRSLEKQIMLSVLDHHWKEYLVTMDYLRQSIHLRGYAQKDPKQEYKREAFYLFKMMLAEMRRHVVSAVLQVEDPASGGQEVPVVGRNELCPCGSQKKYKHCHGNLVDIKLA
jgi:preprotein translocase subunit SecA